MENKERLNILLVDDQPGKLLSYEVMLAELEKNPPKRPARPAYPNRKGMGIKPEDK